MKNGQSKKVLSFIMYVLIAVILIVLIVCPIVMIFLKAVIVDGRLDFMNAVHTIAQSDNVETILNSMLLGVSVVIVSSIIALPLAYILAKTRIGRHKWLDIIFMIPFMTPPYIASMGWILFMQKRGLFQQLFPWTGSFSEKFFSFGGLVLVMSLHVFPFMMTMMKNAMLNIPSSMEESGAVFGAGFGRRIRKILAPLLTGNYAIGALLVFVKTISEYGTPATLGRRIGFYVFTTDIHRYSTTAPVDFGKAASLSSILAIICLLLWFVQNYITTKKSYRLVGGRSNRITESSRHRLGTAASWSYIVLIILVAIGIPYFSIIMTSLIKLRGYGLAKGNFTFQHYINLFTENVKGVAAIRNSIFLAAVSATLTSVLGTAIVLLVNKTKKKAGKLLEVGGLLPEMLPGIVLVIGIMLFWNTMYKQIPVYNTIWIMVIAYTALFLPYSVQYVTSSYSQIGDNLIQAGRTFGGSPMYIMRRITIPLVLKGIVTGWMMTFIIAFRELVTASLIAPPNTLVVSTYIMREFEQGSVSTGMAMAVLCVLITTTSLIAINLLINRKKK